MGHDHPLAGVPEHVLHRPASRRLLDGDRLFRAVVGADGACDPQRVGDLLLEDDAVTELVGAEHVGTEDVTPTVADTEVGIDASRDHGRSVSGDGSRPVVGPDAALATAGSSPVPGFFTLGDGLITRLTIYSGPTRRLTGPPYPRHTALALGPAAAR